VGGVSPRRWAGVAILPIAGFFLLWWADQQLIDMRSDMILMRSLGPWWMVAGWLLTMVAAGVMFGMAAGLAGTPMSKANVGATFVAGLLPLAIVGHYFSFFAFGWSPIGISPVAAFLYSNATAVVSCVVVGWLASGLVRPIPTPNSDLTVERAK
jgi:hypothetical protein